MSPSNEFMSYWFDWIPYLKNLKIAHRTSGTGTAYLYLNQHTLEYDIARWCNANHEFTQIHTCRSLAEALMRSTTLR